MPDQRRAAFFDVDGTLIFTKSLVSFVQFLQQQQIAEIHPPKLALFIQHIRTQLLANAPRDNLNREYFSIYKGLSVSLIEELAQRWFYSMEAEGKFYIVDTITHLRALKTQGYRIVLVTGSFHPLLKGLRETFGVDDLLCTLPETVQGVYTGELIGNPCIGEQKRKAVIQYALTHQLDLAACYAFGDDITDNYMLDIVGHGIWVDAAA